MAEFGSVIGVQSRTLRHWMRVKLLPRPLGRGRSAVYTDAHVARAQLIMQMRAKHMRLLAIRAKLREMGSPAGAPVTVSTSGAEPPPPPGETAASATVPALPPAPPEPNYPAVRGEMIPLMDGLILLVNAEKGPSARRIAAEIYRYYGGPQGTRA